MTSDNATAVATRPQDGALDVWGEIPWEQDAIEGVVPTFPEIKLVQKATPKIPESGKHGGEFWFSDTGRFTQDLDGVFIHAIAIRSFFEDENMGAPVCSSDNGRTPRPNQPLWDMERVKIKNQGEMAVPPTGQPVSCGLCPFKDWQGDNPPACAFGYQALFEDSGESLYRMRFMGTAQREMRAFLARLAGEGVTRKSKRSGRPVFSKRVRVASEETKDGDLMWYVPRITITGPIGAEVAQEYADFATALREQFARVVADSHAEEGEAANGTPAPRWDDGSQPFDTRDEREIPGSVTWWENLNEQMAAAGLAVKDGARLISPLAWTRENAAAFARTEATDAAGLVLLMEGMKART